jgi:hypothetical protein
MSVMSSTDPSLGASPAEGIKHRLLRVPPALRLIAAAVMALLAALQFWLALQSPGRVIERQLVAAAHETAALPWSRPLDQVQLAVGRYFAGRNVEVDARRFPVEVLVTLNALDRNTCLQARAEARRIEGEVVIALEGYRTAADCAERNRMLWRIMP